MWTSARLNNGKSTGYGFGWAVHVVNGHRCLAHTGAHVTGFATAIQRYPEDGLTVVVLTNRYDADTSRIARRLAERYIPALATAASKPGE
jgi:D-alanyl-D-alanine carboxypeptidase